MLNSSELNPSRNSRAAGMTTKYAKAAPPMKSTGTDRRNGQDSLRSCGANAGRTNA